jgi:hypothetical protein
MDELDNPEGQGSYGMVMPFVTVASKGGPHDDESYAAGFEMGGLDATLKALAPFTALVRMPVTIRSVNREQADLIAMKHGFTIDDVMWTDESGPDGWDVIVVRRDVAGGDE